MTDSVQLRHEGAIATITLSQPNKRNAVSQQMWRTLSTTVANLAATPGLRVIVLTGHGRHFCAGADIAEFAEVYADRASAAAYAADLEAAMQALTDCPVPVIGMIRGTCIGAGVSLAVSCDLRFADDSASFAVTPARLGLAYSFGDTRRLVHCIGPAAAKDLLFSARKLDAAAAHQMHLVDRLLSPENLADQTYAYAQTLCDNAPHSLHIAKSCIRAIQAGQQKGDAETDAAYLDAIETQDHHHRRAAFLAGR